MTVSGLRVSVVRKAIRNLHLGVYPPEGRIRVAAPIAISDAAVRVAVIGKLPWIKRQRASFESQARESEREMVAGESHYYRGRRYRLQVVESAESPRVELNGRRLVLHVQPGSEAPGRRLILDRWYRDRLREAVSHLVQRWDGKLGVTVNDWRLKRMKTKWGSCNSKARRIWINTELAKKPLPCLEYVVVHELAHIRERTHSERFIALMDQALPAWRSRRAELNRAPLGHASWGC